MNIQQRRVKSVNINYPPEIEFTANLNEYDVENSVKMLIWKTRPRLPNELWHHLAGKGCATMLKVSKTCVTCGHVLESKMVYSFHIEETIEELIKLGYEVKQKDEERIVLVYEGLNK